MFDSFRMPKSLVTDNPEDHKLISKAEKEYIIENRVKAKRSSLPSLKHFFTSLPMISCWVAHTTHLYVLYCAIPMFPKYLRDVQGKAGFSTLVLFQATTSRKLGTWPLYPML